MPWRRHRDNPGTCRIAVTRRLRNLHVREPFIKRSLAANRDALRSARCRACPSLTASASRRAISSLCCRSCSSHCRNRFARCWLSSWHCFNSRLVRAIRDCMIVSRKAASSSFREDFPNREEVPIARTLPGPGEPRSPAHDVCTCRRRLRQRSPPTRPTRIAERPDACLGQAPAGEIERRRGPRDSFPRHDASVGNGPP